MARAQHSVEQTFRQYTSIYNGVPREWFTKSEEALIDQLFATKVSVIAGYTRNEVQISQLKRLLQGFLQAGRKCEIVHFEFLDDHHIEYKTQITGPKGFESIDHSIARVDEDNKIVSMEPFCKYGTARILFQRKFREYFAMYDGSPKGFGKTEEDLFLNFFAKALKVKIDGQKYNRQQWMEAVKTCIEGGMKVDILNFSFLPNSTKAFEYKIRVSNNDKDEGGLALFGTGQEGQVRFLQAV